MATSKYTEIRVEGLNDILRGLRKLPKEASKELRLESKYIAKEIMVPAWQEAALNYGGPWGIKLASTIRAISDRVPAILVGQTRAGHYSGGASTAMLRYPVDSGEDGNSWYDFPATHWIGKRRDYRPEAMRRWSSAVDRVVAKWPVI